jgi:alpha-tubulin suppressor-like RCC1 family protein
VPVPASISGATDVQAGFHTACATLANTTVYCWGSNDYGAVGINVKPELRKHYPFPLPVVF